MTSNDALNRTFQKAAARALAEWGRSEGADDLVQDLWVWYLESPATQKKFAVQDEFLNRMLSYKAALQKLAGEALDDDTFAGKVPYSIDSVREALHGLSSNVYLKEILPIALEAIQRQDDVLEERGTHRGYAEAIRRRFTDRVVPPQGSEQMRLSRAVKALTDEVNVTYLTSELTGRGTRTAVFPDTRKQNGHHNDPTGEIAVTLVTGPPEVREAYYEQWSPEEWEVDLHTAHDELTPPDAPVNIFDGTFNGMPGSEMYRSEVMPDLFPDAKPMMIGNWPEQDREMYCGGEYHRQAA